MKQLNIKRHLFKPTVALLPLFALEAACTTVLEQSKKSSMKEAEETHKQEMSSAASLHRATYQGEGDNLKYLKSFCEAVHEAVSKMVELGNTEKVESYLKNIEGWSKEAQAEFVNSVSDKDKLTALGFDINNTEKDFSLLLFFALVDKKEQLANILLTKFGATVLNVVYIDPLTGNTFLHIAAREGYLEVVKTLGCVVN